MFQLLGARLVQSTRRCKSHAVYKFAANRYSAKVDDVIAVFSIQT